MNVLEGPRRETRRILAGGRVHSCTVEGDHLRLDDGRVVPEASAHYLPAVDPGVIVCVHLNYRSRAQELGVDLADAQPTYFVKPPTTAAAHRGEIAIPADCRLVNYEGEIAAVVGRPMRRVRAEDVWDHLAGFACANDVGAHDFRDTDAGSMLRVKGQDGFCPIGPGLVCGIDVRRTTLRTYVNGEIVQQAPVTEMAWGIDALFADLTRYLTLRPGDVVLTGTPWHSRPIFPGDTVEVQVDGVGRLTSSVVEAPAPPHTTGFPPTISKTGLAVALGSDYRALKSDRDPPTPDQYRQMRRQLIARNMAGGPPPRSPR